jgi:voltage-gated potassium channel
MRLLDAKEFPTVGQGMWWSVQTVTTVGYGDVVPHATVGRLVALVVMVCAIAFLTVVTAAITATLIERSQPRAASSNAVSVEGELAELNRRLARLEQILEAGSHPSRRG